jgi:adenosylhomocysteine nucleosidase
MSAAKVVLPLAKLFRVRITSSSWHKDLDFAERLYRAKLFDVRSRISLRAGCDALVLFMGHDVVASSLGIVVGMTAEARLLGRTGCAIAVGGGTPVGARRMAQNLVDDGATALISFGLAGGLDPALAAGTLLVPRAVLSQGRLLVCDEALRAPLAGDSTDCLLAATAVVTSASEKLRLWQSTGAGAVDLESGEVAEVAITAGIPFAVLRAVCDPAARDLPSAAVVALDHQGRIAPFKMAGQYARHPWQIPGLIALGRDAARARRALVRGAESLGRLAAGHSNLGGLSP